jgi:predicted TIM-barrel fold metal-dependent hydrolase
MTRREMLALVGASALPPRGRAQDVPFDRIDTHAHIYHDIPALIANMQKQNWRALSICVWQQYDEHAQPGEFQTIDQLLAAAAKVHRESQGRISWAATFDAHRFEERDFTERTITSLNRCFRDGALAVKIWKTIGMKIRGKAGNFLMPDDPTLIPIYQAIQKQDRTLIAHLAEPNGAWMPVDAPENTYAGYYRNNPQWHSQPGDPPKEAILAARDRVLARFPKLRAIGCHLGSNEEDFRALGKRLDTYPNFSVDMAARTRHFFDKDSQTAREFLEKYQDRIVYGSDYTMGNATDDEVAAAVLAQGDREWSLFAGTQNVRQRNREVQGLGLPERLLRKLFHDNAVRLLPGIVPA